MRFQQWFYTKLSYTGTAICLAIPPTHGEEGAIEGEIRVRTTVSAPSFGTTDGKKLI